MAMSYRRLRAPESSRTSWTQTRFGGLTLARLRERRIIGAAAVSSAILAAGC
jgi:hypothetical protein